MPLLPAMDPCMPLPTNPPARDRTHSRGPAPREVMALLILLVATLAMPVSYRAGAAEAHAHTIFQGVVDLLAGHLHHHDHGHDDEPTPAAAPDAPRLLNLSMPISALSAIQVLALLVAALLAGHPARPAWERCARLVPWRAALEIPPPRRA